MANKTDGGPVARLKLIRWMEQGPARERGQSAIARALLLKQASVRAWVEGTSRPVPAHREALAILTGGAVPAAAWETPEERKALKAALKRAAKANRERRGGQSVCLGRPLAAP